MNKLYEGKFFYEVIQTGPEEFRLIGPLDNIFYTAKSPQAKGKVSELFSTDQSPARDFKFVQVIDGRPVQAFTKDEIYVTTTPLVGKKSKLYEGVSNVSNENR